MEPLEKYPREVLKIFESLPDLYLILSPDFLILTASDAYLAATLKKREEITGKFLFDAFPDNPEKESARSLQQVLATKKAHRMAVQSYEGHSSKNAGEQFLEKYWNTLNTQVLNDQGEVSYIIHKVEDVTEQVQQEQRIQKQEQQAPEQQKTYRLINAFDVAFIELDFEQRYLYMNNAAEEYLGKKKEQLLGKNIWNVFPQAVGTAGYHAIRKALTTREKTETEYFSAVFRKYLFVSVVPSDDGVIVLFYDRHDIKEAKQKLAQEHRRLNEAQAIGHVGSFEWDAASDIIYWSDELYRIHGLEPQSELITIEKAVSFVHPEDRDLFKKEVMQWKKEPSSANNRYRLMRANGQVRVVNYQVLSNGNEDGSVVQINGVVQDVTERHKTEETVQQMLNGATSAICVLDAVRDQQGSTIDFVFRGCNKVAAKLYRMATEEMVGKRLLALFPKVKHFFFHNYINVVETGEPLRLEWYDPDEDKWLDVSVVKNGDGIIRSCMDITERKRAEEALQLAHNRLETIFGAVPLQLGYYHSVRDAEGEVVDLKAVVINEASVKKMNLGAVSSGLLMSEQLPGVKEHPIWQTIKQVIETKLPQRMELYYDFGESQVWFDVLYTPIEDGIISASLDITERKKAEQEILKHLEVLKQAEEVALMGSWEYSIDGTLSWSEGMYRLFNLPEGCPVTLQTFLKHVLDKDRPKARRLIRLLQEQKPVEGILRIRVNSQVQTLKIKAIAMRDGLGTVEKTLGVVIDISEVKRLEQENLQMRLEQQKALLIAILEAQEDERRRISESLHNGVGQLLYATKINLEQVAPLVPLQEGPEQQALYTAKRLLLDAISETRRVSHELVPMLVRDFGLEEAFLDLCKTFSRPGFKLRYEVEGLEERLPEHLDLALYRISQELVTNIIRHAGATEAMLQLRKVGQELLLLVKDNGRGFRPAQGAKGLGLQTIRDRTKLLNGTLSFSQPSEGTGTVVSVRIPLQEVVKE